MDFPYRNTYYTDADRLEKFNQLKKINLNRYMTKNKKGKYTNIKLPESYFQIDGWYVYLMYNPKYYKWYMLSDLFNDECRVQCKFGSHISPVEWYKLNKDKVKQKLLDAKLELSPNNIREQIYRDHRECSIHNPLIIKSFIDLYGASTVCDISSGWGDRLIGALLADVDYYFAADPNPCLHPNYQSIIKMYQPLTKNHGTYKIVESKFQDVEMPDIKFDLMYTSPPYFDYEKYTGSTAEADFTSSEDEWLKDFLYISIDKVLNHMNKNGHLVFYFSQENGKTYIEKWMKHMQQKSNVSYVGNVYYCDVHFKGLHPIFIFRYVG